MYNDFNPIDAVSIVLDWGIPESSLAFALNAQANFMAGIDPEHIVGFGLY